MGKGKNKVTACEPDGKWRAACDARTLCEAETIKADAKRHKAAVKEAKSMADQKETEAKAMKKIAGKGKGK